MSELVLAYGVGDDIRSAARAAVVALAAELTRRGVDGPTGDCAVSVEDLGARQLTDRETRELQAWFNANWARPFRRVVVRGGAGVPLPTGMVGRMVGLAVTELE